MMKYLARRVLVAVLSLLVFSFVMFWLVESLIPGDYFSSFRLTMSQEEVDALRATFGVDKPIPVRWWRWLTDFFDGGLGSSTFGVRVASSLGSTIAPTIFVFVSGLALSYAIGQWLGRTTGWAGGLRSDTITLGGIGLSTLFPPFVGFVVTSFVAIRLRRLRAAWFEDVRLGLWNDAPLTENQFLNRMTVALVLGMVVAAIVAGYVWRRRRQRLSPGLQVVIAVAVMVGLWMAMGITPWAIDLLFDAALPLIAFVVLGFGEFMLIMQAGMVGQLNEDFVGTARAKGLKERAIRDRHAARNAAVALLARLAVSVPYLMTGLVIIERSVGWPGIGSFLFAAIDSQDLPVVISVLMVIGAITAVTRLALDLLTFVFDPRIARPSEVQL